MLESAAINFPIQGVGADQKYLAIAALGPLFTKLEGRFLFELHDGLYSVFPDKYAKKAAFAGQKILNALPYKKAWEFDPPIPLPWDIKIGKRWGDSVELP
jgi:DNA polymerase I-like protein with 3'-5' exonuclease and polymerase domains